MQYQEFVDSIRILSSSLERLRDVAIELDSQRRNWQSYRDAQYSTQKNDLLPSAMGNFGQTLEQCDALLGRHGYLQNGRSGAFFNLQWWLKVERTVNDLKAKLKWHIDMIGFYLKPDELASAVRKERQIDQIMQQLANLGGSGSSHRLWSIVLTEELKAKLEEGIATKKPSWLSSESDWPLAEGFQAFTYHFDNGTVNTNPSLEAGNIPTFLDHLNLAKSIFVLTKLKEASYLRTVGTESVWSYRMRDAEDKIRAQLHRFELHELDMPSAPALLSLPSDTYWLYETESKDEEIIDAGTARPWEEKILEVGLSSDGKKGRSSLLVFREGDTDFRLVTSIRQSEATVTQIYEQVDAYMDRDRLIALYATPSHPPSSRHNLLLLDERGKRAKGFAFCNTEDLGKLQQALTGYRLHHSVPVTRWRINGFSQLGDTGKGLVQLWQFKPLKALLGSNVSSGTDAGSSGGNSSLRLSQTSSRKVSKASPPELPAFNFQHDGSWEIDWLSGLHVADSQQTTLSNQEANKTLENGQKAKRHSKLSSFLSKSRTKSSNQRSSMTTTLSGTTYSSGRTVMSPVEGNLSRGFELNRSEMPVLVILTEWDKRYRILHLTRK